MTCTGELVEQPIVSMFVSLSGSREDVREVVNGTCNCQSLRRISGEARLLELLLSLRCTLLKASRKPELSTDTTVTPTMPNTGNRMYTGKVSLVALPLAANFRSSEIKTHALGSILYFNETHNVHDIRLLRARREPPVGRNLQGH